MKIIFMMSFSWCSVFVAGGIPPEQLSSHIKVGVVASREAHALSHLLESVLLKKAQEQAHSLVHNKDGSFEPEAVGHCCNQVVQDFSGQVQKDLKKSSLQTKVVEVLPAAPCILGGTCQRNQSLQPYKDIQTPLYKNISMQGALQPYHVYRFDTKTVRRPITEVTSGSYIAYSALALKDMWQNRWSHEQPSGERDIFALVKEKSALVQSRVKEMVVTYGEQEGPQIYLSVESLREMLTKNIFENMEPFDHVFIVSQEKKCRIVQQDSAAQVFEMHEEVEGEAQELLSFLAHCTQPKVEACACVIDTFIRKPGPKCDHVFAFVSKKVGERGPVFIYNDPLNRGMKKNPRARLFVTFLLEQAIASRLAQKKDGQKETFLSRVQKFF